jgi:NTP pyrophosphatase (non-canonical NTP hydrolase)
MSFSDFDEYQRKAEETAIYSKLYPGIKPIYLYLIMGVIGEAVEVSERLETIIRESDGIIASQDKRGLEKEIGDVLWFLAMLCKELDIKFSDVADANLEKLKDRKKRNMICGSGDNR